MPAATSLKALPYGKPAMPTLKEDQLDSVLSRYRGKDPELYKELKGKVKEVGEARVTRARRAVVGRRDEELVTAAGELTSFGRRVSETIVRPNCASGVGHSRQPCNDRVPWAG